MNRLLAIAWKEFRQLRRDLVSLGVMAAFPVAEVLLFGYAINTDVRHLPLIVYDQDRSSGSRDLIAGLVATGFYDVAGYVANYDELNRGLRRSDGRVAIVIPSRYGTDISRGEPVTAQLIVDGSDPQIVASATNAAAGLIEARSTMLVVERFGPVAAAPLSLEPIISYNPELRTAIFVVPGVIGIILTTTMVMLTSMAIARERERGTLEALIVSPVRPMELMVGKILPYIIIGYIQESLILIAGHLVFSVPFRGSIPLLYILTSVFIGANLALGLVFSTIAKTQQQAMQMSVFVLLPNILISGFSFPWEGMPRPAQWLSEILPLTHYLRIVRGVVLKGAIFEDVQREVIWLSAILVAFIVIASMRFRKKLV